LCYNFHISTRFFPHPAVIFRYLFLLCSFCSLVHAAGGLEARLDGNRPPLPGAIARRPLTQGEIQTALDQKGPLLDLVSQLENTVSSGQSSAFEGFLKTDWLLDTITRPVKAPALSGFDEIETAFEQGTRTSWSQRSLAADYLGHHFRFLRVHTLGGRPGLLFRSVGVQGRLNFCLFTVATGPDGSFGADDLYVLGMSEWVSDTLRRGFLTLIESLRPRGEAGRRATLYIEALPQITALYAAARAQDHAMVLRLSDFLPPELKQDRQILLTRLEAAEHASLEERTRVFSEWQALHPDPQQLPLKWADFQLASGHFDEARAVLGQLNERLGGDSHLMLRLGEIKMLARHHAAGLRKNNRETPVAIHERGL
jgi:hypothetical protein